MKSKTKTLASTVAAVALMAAIPMQSAKAHVGVPLLIGVAVTTGIIGYMIGTHRAHAAAPGYIPMKYRSNADMQYRASNPMDQCAAKYKSFNAHTGMVVVNGGIQKPCPFLTQ